MKTKTRTKVQQHARTRGNSKPKRVQPVTPPKASKSVNIASKAVYSPKLRDKICDLITDGASWREIEQAGMVCQRTLATWLRMHPDFAGAYKLAREARAEALMSEIGDLVQKLHTVKDHVALHAIKLKIDTLKWQVSSYYPRVYGTKTIVETEEPQKTETYDYSRLEDHELKIILSLLEKALVKPEDD